MSDPYIKVYCSKETKELFDSFYETEQRDSWNESQYVPCDGIKFTSVG
jgi:hypothetical protein